jgi:hypothetical protein
LDGFDWSQREGLVSSVSQEVESCVQPDQFTEALAKVNARLKAGPVSRMDRTLSWHAMNSGGRRAEISRDDSDHKRSSSTIKPPTGPGVLKSSFFIPVSFARTDSLRVAGKRWEQLAGPLVNQQ